MLTRTFVLALLAVVAIGATASAQTPIAAAPGVVEPSIAFVGSGTAVALRNNGDVLTWGNNDSCLLGRSLPGQPGKYSGPLRPDPNPVVVMHNAKDIATAGTTIAVLTAEGKVYSWGLTTLPMASGYWVCDGPAPVPSLECMVVTRIGLGQGVAVAVTAGGDLYCAGASIACPANLTRNPDSSFRASNAAVAAFTRLSLPELNGNVLDIRVGGQHTLVLTKDRKLYAFGSSQAGQLGDSRFAPRGAVSGVTPEPVLTSVVSFAAGQAHSVAVKDDGTVWSWGRNGETFSLCDGTTVDRRVPAQLTLPAGRVVEISASIDSTIVTTAEGALYACGGDSYGQLGLAAATESTKRTPISRPTQVQLPVAKSSIVVMGEQHAAVSPDGCSVHIAGIGGNGGVRGAIEPPSPRFALRAGLSLCAPRLATPMPDAAADALHRVPTPPPGVDCWIPKTEEGPKDPKLEPLRKALLTVERLIKDNRTFTVATPEGVRMEIATVIGNGGNDSSATPLASPVEAQIEANAYPHQLKAGALLYWTPTGCDIVRTSPRLYESPLGELHVILNPRLDAAEHRGAKFLGVVDGFPVFRYVSVLGITDKLVITKDGRLPLTPVTLVERLDGHAAHLATRLEEVRKRLAAKPPASVEALLQPEHAELRRQVDALRAYRASFSADELRAAWVQHDPQGRGGQELQARVKAIEAMSPEDQAQVNDLGTRARALQRQATSRGTAPAEAARLRNEANDLLQKAAAIAFAQRTRVAAQVTAVRNDFAMQLMRPGAAADATELREDPTFWDTSDVNRIQLIIVTFSPTASRETSYEQAKAWMDSVKATLDYQALKALLR